MFGVCCVDDEALSVDVEDPYPLDLVVAVEVAPFPGAGGYFDAFAGVAGADHLEVETLVAGEAYRYGAVVRVNFWATSASARSWTDGPGVKMLFFVSWQPSCMTRSTA